MEVIIMTQNKFTTYEVDSIVIGSVFKDEKDNYKRDIVIRFGNLKDTITIMSKNRRAVDIEVNS